MPWRTIDGEELVDTKKVQLEVVLKGVFDKRRLLDLIRYSPWNCGDAGERLALLPSAQEHVLKQEDGKKRFIDAVTELSKAFALAVPHEKALEIRDDIAFFQAIKSVLAKGDGEGAGNRTPEEVEHAIRQIVSSAVSSNEVIDIFSAAGLKKPDISILSDEFLAEVRHMPQRNLAVELLRKLLEGEIKSRGKKNVVQARSFSELCKRSRKIGAKLIFSEFAKSAIFTDNETQSRPQT